nr:hypothetical protein [Tanacetum cinerariifolium]
MQWPPISASIIIGPSVPLSSPRGGKRISGLGEKLCVILCLATLSQDRRHPKIEHNDFLIAREEIAAASKTEEKKEDEKKTKKRRKESQILLSQEDLKKYDREWWELCDLIQLVNPETVIPLNIFQEVLEKNMLVLDPSTSMEWTPAKNNTWKERIASTLRAYEFVTRTICGDTNYPLEGGINHEKKCKRFKSLLKTN